MVNAQQYINNYPNKLDDALVINNLNLEGELNLSEFINLKYLHCPFNKITALNLSKNKELLQIHCSGNQVSELNLEFNNKLTKLTCDGNLLESLNLAKNTQIEKLSCAFNELKVLNLKENTNLTELNCQFNGLIELDLTENKQLVKVTCVSNQLTSLKIGENNNLISVHCSNNKLNELNLENNPNLLELECFLNPLLKKTNIKINEKITEFGGYPLPYLIPLGEEAFQNSVKFWWKKLADQYDKKEDFYELMVLIDYSDLDDLVNKLNLQTINDPELLSKFIPKEYLPLVPQLSLRVILDNLANQLLARCLITQSRLHFGKDEEYEDRITRLSLDWQKCSFMREKQIVHPRNTTTLADWAIYGDEKIRSRIMDLDYIKKEYKKV